MEFYAIREYEFYCLWWCYRSTPRPIYILHTPNQKLPRSAEVLQSKSQWVRDVDSSTQSPGHTVNYNGSVTLIHSFQSHGPVVSRICQSSTTRLRQGCSDRSLWQGRSDKVTLTWSLWHGHSDKVGLTRSLWQGRSDKIALTMWLWQGCSDKVALTGCSDRLLWQAHPTLLTSTVPISYAWYKLHTPH